MALAELSFLLLDLEHVLLVRVQHDILDHLEIARKLVLKSCLLLRIVLLQRADATFQDFKFPITALRQVTDHLL